MQKSNTKNGIKGEEKKEKRGIYKNGERETIEEETMKGKKVNLNKSRKKNEGGKFGEIVGGGWRRNAEGLRRQSWRWDKENYGREEEKME